MSVNDFTTLASRIASSPKSRRSFVASTLLFALFPCPGYPQCRVQLCLNLQTIVDAAKIDFREYLRQKTAGPDVSIEGTKVPCQVSRWANYVPMYICYAEVPYLSAEVWYSRAMEALTSLTPTWQFQIASPGEDHFVDGGPQGCEISQTDGPYIGQCPFHLEITKQRGGTAKLCLWMNSFSSPYLVRHAFVPAAKPVEVAAVSGCDDFCETIKRAFEVQTNAIEDIQMTKTNEGVSATKARLLGARECKVSVIKYDSGSKVKQFVCYWREASTSAAESRFRELLSRLQIMVPSNWSRVEENELDEPIGANYRKWHGLEPGGKHDIRLYVLGEFVGLHISTWN